VARSAADIETLPNIGDVDLQAAKPDLLPARGVLLIRW